MNTTNAVPLGFEVDELGRTLGSGLYVPEIERVRYHVPIAFLNSQDSEGATTDGASDLAFDGRMVAHEGHPANVYSSFAADAGEGMHAPVLDLDLPAGNALHCAVQSIYNVWHQLGVGFDHVHLVKSTNHYHAYVEHAIPFDAFLYGVGVLVGEKHVQPFYGQMILRRGASFVRLPGLAKPSDDPAYEPMSPESMYLAY